MATTKTLTPTNQTITIAAFQGEKPDQKQVADAESKLADAINALNSQLTSVSSGSLHDIVKTGVYFLTSAVTDKPVMESGYGGTYQVAVGGNAQNPVIAGTFVSMYDGSVWSVKCLNGTWTYTEYGQAVKTAKITFTPPTNLAAGESGYFNVPVPAALRGKKIVAVSFGVNHVAQSYGYQLTGTYISTLDTAYISYYTPRAVTAANADFDMTIAYI